MAILILLLSVLPSCDKLEDLIESNTESTSADTSDTSETTSDASDELLENTIGEPVNDTTEQPFEDTTEKPLEDTTDAPSENTTVEPSESTHVHSFGEWVTVKEPTCQKEGYMERVCSCMVIDVKTLPKIDHDYLNDVCTMCKKIRPGAATEPDHTADGVNIVGSTGVPLTYTAQGGYLYYSIANEIRRTTKSGNSDTLIYTVPLGYVTNLNIIGDWLYFYAKASTPAKSYIGKVKTDGSGFEKLITSLSVCINEMLVVKDTIYYTTITENWKYQSYSNEFFPLYRLSVNGGIPTQIQDGAVGNLTADGTYVYFNYSPQSGVRSICKIKHGEMGKTVLYRNDSIVGLTIENSKLYFIVINEEDENASNIASISKDGGDYKTYGNIYYYGYDQFYVVGNKAYFEGSEPCTESNPEPLAGIIEYDLNTKTFKQIKEYDSYSYYSRAFDIIICETDNYGEEKPGYFEIYNPKTGRLKKINLS